jgi:hypothetical protein
MHDTLLDGSRLEISLNLWIQIVNIILNNLNGVKKRGSAPGEAAHHGLQVP